MLLSHAICNLWLVVSDAICVLQAEARDPSVVMKTLVSGIMATWAAGSSYPVAEVRSALGQAGTVSTSHVYQPCPLAVSTSCFY